MLVVGMNANVNAPLRLAAFLTGLSVRSSAGVCLTETDGDLAQRLPADAEDGAVEG